ncbi:HEAT repeat domain-containing protein [Candidatus Desantisbacteria bacterium]|nr:HEAT repeat domain-containing protein [Candidatus Desantisbacteria bacterium]
MRFILLSIVLIALSTHVYGNEISTNATNQSLEETPQMTGWKPVLLTTNQSLDEATPAQDNLSLISALKDTDEAIRMQAAETLGDSISAGKEVCSKEAVTALIHALNDPKWRVKRNAVISLGKIGSPAAIPALIKCLKDENWIIRDKAVHALGEIGSIEAADAIIHTCKDEDESVQKEAIAALGKIRATKAILLLINILIHSTEDKDIICDTDSNYDKCMKLAVWSLIEIGTPSTIPLLRILRDKNPQVRQYAAYGLGEIRDIRTISPLIEALSEEDELPRRDISSALIKMGTTAVPALLPYLDTNDMDLEGCIIWILGEIGDKQATPSLTKILTSARDSASIINPSILKKTVWALGKIGDSEALPTLISWLKNDYGIEESVIIAIGRINDEKAVRMFTSALHGDVTNLLWDEINDSGIDMLIIAAQDTDAEIRRCAAAALGKTLSKKAVEPLIAMLNDDDWRTQRNAVIGLGEIGDKKAVPYLINLLNLTPEGLPPAIWTVRGNAAIALGKMKDPAAIPPLIQSLKDEESFIRACAAEALGRIQNTEVATLTVDTAIIPLIELLNDTDTSVQEAAVSALINIGSSCIPYLLKSIDRTNTTNPQPPNKIHVFTIFGKLQAAGAKDILVDNLSIGVSPSKKDKKITGRAAWALGEIGDRGAIEPLIKKLRDDTLIYQELLPQTIEAVGKLKAEEAIPYLIEFLQQEGAPLAERASLAEETPLQEKASLEEEIASITTSALVNIGTACVPSLIEVLSHGTDTARAHATLALGQLKDKRAVSPLTAMLKDEAWYVRGAAVIALGEIADASAIEPLAATAMEDKNEDVRVYAANALGKIDDDEVIKFLMISLDDSNPDIQLNAALALGERGYLEGIQLLIEYLNARDPLIRKIVTGRLIKIGTITIPALIKAMGHKNNTIRKVATDVLTTMGDDAIIPLLQVFEYQDGDQEIVRWYAAIALGSLLEKTQDISLQEKIILALSSNLNNDSWYGRGGAAIAIGNISTNQDTLVEALLKGLNDSNGVVRTTTAEALGKIGAPRALKMLTIISNNDTEACVRAAAKAAIARIQRQVE